MSNVIGKCNTVGNLIMVWCPACETAHAVDTRKWHFDGNHQSPTFLPSLLSRTGPTICHSYVRNGHFEYLPDCNHALAGKTVPVPEWPYKEESTNA